jgi:hypothetical protein
MQYSCPHIQRSCAGVSASSADVSNDHYPISFFCHALCKVRCALPAASGKLQKGFKNSGRQGELQPTKAHEQAHSPCTSPVCHSVPEASGAAAATIAPRPPWQLKKTPSAVLQQHLRDLHRPKVCAAFQVPARLYCPMSASDYIKMCSTVLYLSWTPSTVLQQHPPDPHRPTICADSECMLAPNVAAQITCMRAAWSSHIAS